MRAKLSSLLILVMSITSVGFARTPIQLTCEPGYSDLSFTHVKSARDFAITGGQAASVLAVGDVPHHLAAPYAPDAPNWPCYWNWTGSAASNPVILPQPFPVLHVVTTNDDYYVEVTGSANAVNVGTGGNLPTIVGYLKVPYAYTWHTNTKLGVDIVTVYYWTHGFYWADNGAHSYANPVDIDPSAAPAGGSVATGVNDATSNNGYNVQIVGTFNGQWTAASSFVGQAGIYSVGSASPWIFADSYQSEGNSINAFGNICGNESYYSTAFQPEDPAPYGLNNANGDSDYVGFVYNQIYPRPNGWSSTITYASGNYAIGSDHYIYVSQVNGNLNHDPTLAGNSGYWQRAFPTWYLPGRYVPTGTSYTWQFPSAASINDYNYVVGDQDNGAKNTIALLFQMTTYPSGLGICTAALNSSIPVAGVDNGNNVVGSYVSAPNLGNEVFGWWINYVYPNPPGGPTGYDPTPLSNLNDDCYSMVGITRVFSNVAGYDTVGPVIY